MCQSGARLAAAALLHVENAPLIRSARLSIVQQGLYAHQRARMR